MSDQQPKFQMTAKLPLLLAGLVIAGVGLFMSLRWHGRVAVVGAGLMLSGAALIAWSSTIHKWCEPVSHQFGTGPNNWRWGDPAYDQPSLRTCLEMTGFLPPKASSTPTPGYYPIYPPRN